MSSHGRVGTAARQNERAGATNTSPFNGGPAPTSHSESGTSMPSFTIADQLGLVQYVVRDDTPAVALCLSSTVNPRPANHIWGQTEPFTPNATFCDQARSLPPYVVISDRVVGWGETQSPRPQTNSYGPTFSPLSETRGPRRRHIFPRSGNAPTRSARRSVWTDGPAGAGGVASGRGLAGPSRGRPASAERCRLLALLRTAFHRLTRVGT